MSTIGERLRELRGGSSQREMAEAVGIKWNAWARYEAGGSLPGAEILERICRVHSCSADWLLGLRGTAPQSSTPPLPHSSTPNSQLSPGSLPQCAKCPMKKRLEKLEKAFKA